MKTLLGLLFASSMALGACASYSGVGVTSDGKAVIAKNDGFLFGLMRKVYVCNVTPGGVTNCAAADSP
jgi:hypothetical protein